MKFKKIPLFIIGIFIIITGWVTWRYNPKFQCEQKGSRFKYLFNVGASRTPMCFEEFSDGGKDCTKKEDCQGYCLKIQETDELGKCEERYPNVGCTVHRNMGFACID